MKDVTSKMSERCGVILFVVPINRQGLNTSKGQKYVTVLYLTEAGYAQKYKNDNPQVENM